MSKLTKYREKLNLTQNELADKSGVSVRTIQRIEAGSKPKGHSSSTYDNVWQKRSQFNNQTNCFYSNFMDGDFCCPFSIKPIY